jgi:phenylacetate-CoA ligase
MLKARGIDVRQSYGTADLGLIAYETEPMAGLVVDEGVIVEILRPGTGDPVAAGEVGEVVVTTLCMEYPLIRFATGDLSAVAAGVSACGRTNMRIKGWDGPRRPDNKSQRHVRAPFTGGPGSQTPPEILKARLTVEHDAERNDRMRLRCEVRSRSDALSNAMARACATYPNCAAKSSSPTSVHCQTTARSSKIYGSTIDAAARSADASEA